MTEELIPVQPPFTVRSAVLQAIGHASVCWDEDGVFDPDEAIEVADALIATLGLDPDEVVHDVRRTETTTSAG